MKIICKCIKFEIKLQFLRPIDKEHNLKYRM